MGYVSSLKGYLFLLKTHKLLGVLDHFVILKNILNSSLWMGWNYKKRHIQEDEVIFQFPSFLINKVFELVRSVAWQKDFGHLMITTRLHLSAHRWRHLLEDLASNTLCNKTHCLWHIWQCYRWIWIKFNWITVSFSVHLPTSLNWSESEQHPETPRKWSAPGHAEKDGGIRTLPTHSWWASSS